MVLDFQRWDVMILTKSDTPLALNPKVMYKHLVNSKNLEVVVKEKVPDAIKYALLKADEKDAVCVTGSHFTVGNAARDLLP